MRKENVLVGAIVCIAAIGFIIYHNDRSSNNMYLDSGNVRFNNGNGMAAQNREAADLNDEFVKSGHNTGIVWHGYSRGMALAKRQDKPVFLYFYADWCTYCRKLKSTTFKDETVINNLGDNFISIAVDTDKNRVLAKQWGVNGLPTMWFIEEDGSKIDSIPGYVDGKHFLYILKYISTKSYERISFHEFIKTL
jgi:thiol:disulfide interchange protein